MNGHSGRIDRMGLERYKVTLAYDGTNFFGFQRQGETRTVQLEVEAALRRLKWQEQTILSAGRTDSGVHASGHVIAFNLDWAHGTERLGRALNANLPEDVAVKAIEVVRADFHPRYDARARCYHYHVQYARERDPLRDRYTWRFWPPCELERLQAAARLLHGTYDFAAFGTPPRPGGSTIRTVFEAGWFGQEERLARFEVTANAFLYHMVRRMVFVQVLIGQQRLSLEALQEALAEPKTANLPPGLALPQGLNLKEVFYAETMDCEHGGHRPVIDNDE
ncbi:MAG: tRNA pseudouridine(38-40) synthase TruA [Chloroflexi bacterium]|nr:MAG: tRNA pseudouridine(38-40) synthase TruA [Chloroflexota bacterium]